MSYAFLLLAHCDRGRETEGVFFLMVGPHWPLLLTLDIPLCPSRPRSENTDVQPNAPLLRLKSMYGALKQMQNFPNVDPFYFH